jgi:[protein-PII] uridylyltransferase
MTLGAGAADGAGVPHANRFVVGFPSANSRRRRSAAMDHRLRELFAAAGGGPGLALVAVGGYGRSELAPNSDVDVVLVHHPRVGRDVVASMADRIWYPLWNDGVDLDHAVRDADQMRQAAADDLRAAIGMLDLRHVAGDEQLSHALRSAALTDWRRSARRRLPELAAAGRDRAERFGELAHSAVPDLKESVGGLRDGVVLRALVATWLVDVPHAEAEGCRAELLDIRDALHVVTGRRTNRLAPELLPDLAEALAATPEALAAGGAATEGRAPTAALAATPEGLARHVRALGRRVAHLSLLTWRRIDQALERPRDRASIPPKRTRLPGRRYSPDRPPTRRPQLIPMDRGVARVGGEVVLTAEASPTDDPGLSLRVAALAAEGGLLVSPSTASRLARSAGPLPEPWGSDLRRLFVRLLASGPGLPPVWEELDQAGVVQRWLPEWEAVRHLPSEAAIHRYTVDWHSVQACVEAASRLRRVSRPDLLVVATLLHDIGKGQRGDHSVAGAEIASKVASRMGFAAVDVERIGALVARHLLLPETATRRDLDDPATIDAVASEVGELSTLDLLAALTESDARATAPAAWSSWRAGLVGRLVAACEERLRERRADEQPAPPPASQQPPAPALQPAPAPALRSEPALSCGGTPVAGHPVRLAVEATVDGSRIRVVADDRICLLADVAGAWAWAGLVIRGCRAYSVGGRAVSEWDLGSPPVDPATLAHRLRRILDNDVRLGDRLPAARSDPPPRVEAIDTASPTATVVEIRAQDQRGLLWRACRALARSGVNVRSAHVDTLGPQAVDVLYLVDEAGRPLSPGAVAAAVSAMRSALT